MFSRGERDKRRVKWAQGVSNMVKDGNQTFVGELTSRSRNKVEIKIKTHVTSQQKKQHRMSRDGVLLFSPPSKSVLLNIGFSDPTFILESK